MRFGEIELFEQDAFFARTTRFRQPVSVIGATAAESETQTFPLRETAGLQNAIVEELSARVTFVNPPWPARYHEIKPALYAVLQRAGVPVPPFAVGCDLAAAAHFVDEHAEDVVVKPLMGGEVYAADFAWLKEHHCAVDERPLLLQKRIRGRSLRAYTVFDRVVASAEIVHGDVVDWRCDTRGLTPVTLEDSVAAAVLRAARSTGLTFSSVDMEEETSGQTWIIDVNPGPMFANFEHLTGLDVAGPLAEELIANATKNAARVPSAGGLEL
jgi:glutathione synthase/RimK-type ligase-like ATP-grasp enzyme